MTQRRTLEKSKMFECQDCGYRVRVTATYHNSHVFEMPPECPNIVEKEKKDSMLSKLFHRMDKRRSKSKDHSDGKETSKTRQEKCGGKKFKGCAEEIVYMDYQEFKLQEPFRHLVSGRMPQTITVLVEGESLIDACRPGDDIYVSGVLHHRFEKLFKDRLSQA
jgi:DNA replicative helicase MCM subunit Mcm2 (Cdc46/Mcm family)